MFLIDDILLRMLGLSIKPFDLIWYLSLMKDYALKEKYDIKKIKNRIKENRLMFEMGMVIKEDYKKNHQELIEQLQVAEEALSHLSKDVRIQEVK